MGMVMAVGPEDFLFPGNQRVEGYNDLDENGNNCLVTRKYISNAYAEVNFRPRDKKTWSYLLSQLEYFPQEVWQILSVDIATYPITI